MVGIGSSAGGLEALEMFFKNAPDNPGIAFVIVSHLDPQHPSILAEILSRFTAMEVLEAKNGAVVAPNKVYVIPPGKDINIKNGTLKLSRRVREHEPSMPIDYFLRSLAEDQEAFAIAVILSGNGADGTLGLHSVHANLGMVMVQSSESAKFPSMPMSAESTGLADYVLPPEDMPAQMVKYFKGLGTEVAIEEGVRLPKEADALRKILTLVRNETGHDFSLYKHSTINRRIERRMNIHQISSKEKYAEFLRKNPHEVHLLFREMLIQVTKFFRDPEAFDSLKEILRETIFATKSKETGLRVWVPGCSTGEEVYSIAIILKELMRETDTAFDVQIFGTDIDEEAINSAREGEYPLSISADVGADRLKQFFVKENDKLKVKKDIREMAVSAPQDIIRDPAFLRLDMISCRNLLIYFEPALQKRVLETFSYALNPKGILFLGTSETISGFNDEFATLESKNKLFQRRQYQVTTPPRTIPARPEPMTRGPHVEPSPIKTVNIHETADRLLLADFTPPSVIIDEKNEIIYFNGRTGNYLEPSPEKASLNIETMLRDNIRFPVMSAIREAKKARKEVVKEASRILTKGESSFLNILVRPIEPLKAIGGILVVFQEITVPKEIMRERYDQALSKGAETYVNELKNELSYTKESLQSTIEELETSNEELKSTNEELQSTNEELQSVAEESETAKEEMNSLNEELMSVNTELETKNQELAGTNSDMRNLLNSIDVATLFLDRSLKIRRFTPQIDRIMHLLPADIGRPLKDITMNLAYGDLIKDAKEVLESLNTRTKEITANDGTWYSVKILPYRTIENVIDGVVVTFADIDIQKKTQEKLQSLSEDLNASLDYAEGIVDSLREPILILDPKLQVISANVSFYETFKVSCIETEGTFLFDLGNGQWNIPKLREQLEEILPKNQKFIGFVVEHDFPEIGYKKMALNARRLIVKNKGIDRILLAVEDITEENKRSQNE